MPRMKLCHILVFLIAVLISACKEYSTNDILSVKFPTGGTKGLRITAPSPITVGQPFTITVTATNTVRPGGIQQEYQNPVNVTLQVGGGTLASVTGGGWFLGTQNFTVVYNNPSLSLNSTEVILLRVTDSTDASFTTVSNNITVTSQVVFNQFRVVVPGVVFKDQPFTATITAINSDNTTNTAYNGTVNLTTYLQVGTVSPATVTGFVNGVATTTITFTQSYTNLQIKAADSVTSTISGLSNLFQVYFDSVSLAVFAPTATSLRLEWTYPTGTNTAYIYRDSGSGLQLLSTQYSPTNYYADASGLTTGTSYTYQIVVQNTLGTIQYSATKTAAPAACTTLVPAASSIGSGGTFNAATWTAAGSPYCISGTNTVQGTLTIDAGVVVLAAAGANTSMTVGSGATLISQGTTASPVVFTSSNIVPVAGDWRGIIFASGAVGSTIASDNYISGSKISDTRISYAGPGISTAESLYIDNSTVQNNRNTITPGGGIYANLTAGKQLVIRNSLILNNSTIPTNASLSGGGVYSTQRTAIYSSRISGNSAAANNVNVARGAGIYSGGAGSLLVSNQILQNSLALSGSSCCLYGAGAYLDGDNNTVIANTFRGNKSIENFAGGGSALYLAGAGTTISNNIFDANISCVGVCNGASGGGAVFLGGGANIISRNTFTGNTHTGANASLPAGGIAVAAVPGNSITYNEISTNIAKTCGGMDILSPATLVTNNNIYSNSPNSICIKQVGTFDLTNNYWGGPTSGLNSMGICDSTTTPACLGTANIAGAVATPYPLCKAAPTDPNCVGANF